MTTQLFQKERYARALTLLAEIFEPGQLRRACSHLTLAACDQPVDAVKI
jgi:hypothetical protein